MIILAALLLTGLTLGYVLYPFFGRGQPAAASVEDEQLEELRSKRDTTYAMLKEIEFDRESGILSEKDSRELEVRYRQKAIGILKEMDHLAEDGDVAREIERRIRELRRGKARFCSQCGAGLTPGDRFCSQCGQSLSSGEGN